MNFLFNDKEHQDTVIVLAFISKFTKGAGYDLPSVSVDKIDAVISSCRHDNFPHKDGYEKASAFKKLANFIVHFIAEQPSQSNRCQRLFPKLLWEMNWQVSATIKTPLSLLTWPSKH